MKVLAALVATFAVVLGCDTNLSGSGTFSSPNHPSNYPASSDCTYTLTATAGQCVLITFTAFDVESNTGCTYDSVSVKTGGTTGSGMCGTTVPEPMYTGNNQAEVVFTSDSSVQKTGFSASFSSYACDARPTTAQPPAGGCGGVFTGPSGTFASPNHPNAYDNNMDCTYTINSEGPFIITLSNMDIEANSGCNYDYLEYNGAKFCGTGRQTITVQGDTAVLTFKSDGSVTGTGFSASFEALTCEYYGGQCVLNGGCDGTTRDVTCANGGTCCVPRGECGRIPLNPNQWIIGGAESDANAWPWQASLQTTTSSFHFCGATLVSDQWLVTAAHCVDGDPASSIKVILGEHVLDVSGTESTHAIDQIIVHPSYETGEGAFPNDIAMIRLQERVIFSDYIQAACLADAGDIFHTNNNCWISGWGNTEDGTKMELQELNIDVLDQPTCETKWGTNINAGHICLGNGLSGACNGDSGGPLVCEMQTENGEYFWKLAGATSWGRSGCQTEGFPSVYSRITFFRDWIDATMAQN